MSAQNSDRKLRSPANFSCSKASLAETADGNSDSAYRGYLERTVDDSNENTMSFMQATKEFVFSTPVKSPGSLFAKESLITPNKSDYQLPNSDQNEEASLTKRSSLQAKYLDPFLDDYIAKTIVKRSKRIRPTAQHSSNRKGNDSKFRAANPVPDASGHHQSENFVSFDSTNYGNERENEQTDYVQKETTNYSLNSSAVEIFRKCREETLRSGSRPKSKSSKKSLRALIKNKLLGLDNTRETQIETKLTPDAEEVIKQASEISNKALSIITEMNKFKTPLRAATLFSGEISNESSGNKKDISIESSFDKKTMNTGANMSEMDFNCELFPQNSSVNSYSDQSNSKVLPYEYSRLSETFFQFDFMLREYFFKNKVCRYNQLASQVAVMYGNKPAIEDLARIFTVCPTLFAIHTSDEPLAQDRDYILELLLDDSEPESEKSQSSNSILNLGFARRDKLELELSKFAQQYCIRNELPLFNDPLESSRLSKEFMALPITTIPMAPLPELHPKSSASKRESLFATFLKPKYDLANFKTLSQNINTSAPGQNEVTASSPINDSVAKIVSRAH